MARLILFAAGLTIIGITTSVYHEGAYGMCGKEKKEWWKKCLWWHGLGILLVLPGFISFYSTAILEN